MSGQIYGFNQVFDANGDPLSGALLYTYVPGTTTPKPTYNAPDLLSPLTNPIVADSAGRFPQIWAETGDNFDLVLEDADNVTIESYYEVTALGSEGNAIEIDFGTDGRFAVLGRNGEPNIEFGDPAGDDVGGDGRIGGWNDTQGTNLEIDFATTEFTGAIQTNGNIGTSTYPNAVPFKLADGSATAAATTVINLDSRFNRWQIVMNNVVQSASGSPTVVMSFDNGATYKTGASDYVNQNLRQTNGSAGASPQTAAANIPLSGANVLTDGLSMYVIDIIGGSSIETRLMANYMIFGASVAGTGNGMTAGSTNNKNFGKVTNIRIGATSGNLTFTWYVIGMP